MVFYVFHHMITCDTLLTFSSHLIYRDMNPYFSVSSLFLYRLFECCVRYFFYLLVSDCLRHLCPLCSLRGCLPMIYVVSTLYLLKDTGEYLWKMWWMSPLFYKIDNYLWYKMGVFSIFYTKLLTYEIRRERPLFLVTVQHHHAFTQSFTDGNIVVPGGGVRVYRKAPPLIPSKAWLNGVTQTMHYE